MCTIAGRIRQAEWPQVKVAALPCRGDSEACQGKGVDFLRPNFVRGRRGQCKDSLRVVTWRAPLPAEGGWRTREEAFGVEARRLRAGGKLRTRLRARLQNSHPRLQGNAQSRGRRWSLSRTRTLGYSSRTVSGPALPARSQVESSVGLTSGPSQPLVKPTFLWPPGWGEGEWSLHRAWSRRLGLLRPQLPGASR